MDRLIIDGSHFGAVLEAVTIILHHAKYQATDTELVYNDETEEYIFRLRGEDGEVIATIPY